MVPTRTPDEAIDAVIAGHVCLDVIPRFPRTGATDIADLFRPGKLLKIDGAAFSTGGPVSNTGLALIRLGIRACLMGKIGDDFFGECLRSLFRQWDADGALAVVPGEDTSFTIALAPPGIDRIFLHHPGANDTFCAEDVDYDLVGRARLFHLGYPPVMRRLYADGASELVEVFRRAKETGASTSLDMSLPDPNSESGQVDWQGVLSRVLPFVDIAPFSAEEAMFMLNRKRFGELKAGSGGHDPLAGFAPDDFCWLGRRLLEFGAAIVPLKCGYRGMLLFTGGADRIAQIGRAAPEDPRAWACRELWHPAFLVDPVVSATGSGDSSIAGFLAALLRRCAPEKALATSCCTGGQNVKVLDAISGIHTWDETQAMIADWPQRDAGVTGNWSYEAGARIWRGSRDGIER